MADFFATYSTLKRTVDPSVLPVSLAEAKSQCRVDHDEEDSLISAMISAATEYCEAYTKRQFITGTWTCKLDRFPSDGILLRINPVSSVSSISYNDSNGDAQTLSSSLYTVDANTEPARIVPAWGESWPVTRGHLNDVTVTFMAGYGSAATSVPARIKNAILLLVGHLYQTRESASEKAIREVPMGLRALLDSACWSRVH